MIEYRMISETGNRLLNEDSLAVYDQGESLCAILADGLGGHRDGRLASSMVVKYFGEKYPSCPPVSGDTVASYIEECQYNLLKCQELTKSHGMKTTLAILMAGNGNVVWGHVGDSRIYYFKKNKLVSRTFDHSVPQMLAEAGRIREKDIRMHPDRNRLLCVLGAEWGKKSYTISEAYPLEEDQAFLLCSDGFWEWIDEHQMEKCLKRSEDAESWILRMQKIVEKKGKNKKMDNYSAIAIWT